MMQTDEWKMAFLSMHALVAECADHCSRLEFAMEEWIQSEEGKVPLPINELQSLDRIQQVLADLGLVLSSEQFHKEFVTEKPDAGCAPAAGLCKLQISRETFLPNGKQSVDVPRDEQQPDSLDNNTILF